MNVIIVFGLPGSGKTYFAERLADVLSASYLSTDKIRSESGQENDYSFLGKMKIYNRMLELSREELQKNRTVVLDGTFYKSCIRDRILKYFRAMNIPVVFLEIKADSELIKKRLIRKRSFSQADYSVYKNVKTEFEKMCVPHYVIYSNDTNIDCMVRFGLKYVQATNGYDLIEV